MTESRNLESRWRIDLAGELCSTYSAHPDVIMTCLGGSAARGISDQWSDLDIIIYWNHMDEKWIRSEPLSSVGLSRKSLMNTAPGCFIESYYLENLKIDLGHVRLSQFREWLEPLHSDDQMDHELIGSIGGFLSGIVFSGREVYRKLEQWIGEYPDSLAEDVIRKNLGFYVNGYLDGQCFARGDLLAYQDGFVAMLKKVLNTTAALNGYWFHAGEARWVEFHLSQMEIKPSGLTWENVKWMLQDPGPKAVSLLGEIQEELMALVVSRFPGLEDVVSGRRSRMQALSVKPCTGPVSTS